MEGRLSGLFYYIHLKNKNVRHCEPPIIVISLYNHYGAKQSVDLLQRIASRHFIFCKPHPFYKAFAMTPLF
jgi:predicted metal-binding membrane protein